MQMESTSNDSEYNLIRFLFQTYFRIWIYIKSKVSRNPL